VPMLHTLLHMISAPRPPLGGRQLRTLTKAEDHTEGTQPCNTLGPHEEVTAHLFPEESGTSDL